MSISTKDLRRYLRHPMVRIIIMLIIITSLLNPIITTITAITINT